jgi:hypothetical protein
LAHLFAHASMVRGAEPYAKSPPRPSRGLHGGHGRALGVCAGVGLPEAPLSHREWRGYCIDFTYVIRIPDHPPRDTDRE